MINTSNNYSPFHLKRRKDPGLLAILAHKLFNTLDQLIIS